MKKRVTTHVLYGVFILSPIILLIFLSYIFRQNLFLGAPLWSDEVSYWKEVFSFANCGFKTGYIGINELIPKVAQFSTHGFFPPIFYYPFAKLLGWQTNGIVISNLIFTVICFALIIAVCKPNISQTIKITFLYLLFPPIILYAASSMTEVLNYGFLVLFFCFFYKYCNSEGKSKKYFMLLTILIGTICSLYRITYILLFLVPVFVLSDLKPKKFIKLFLSWILYSGFLCYITSIFIAPYAFGIIYRITHTSNLSSAMKILISNFKVNIKNLVNVSNGEKIEVYFRFFYLFVLILYLLLIFFKVSFKKSNKDFIKVSLREKFNRFYIAQFVLLFSPLLVILIIYDVWDFRDFRALVPVFWISFFNLVIYKRTFTLKIFKPIFLLFFLISIFNWPKSFCVLESARYSSIEKRDFTLIQDVVQYNENAIDPFENTVSTDVFFDFELWSNLHPGIGVEWLASDLKVENYKSKYLLINENKDINGYENKGRTEFGYLYKKL